MLRDNLVGLIEPILSSAGAYPLALCTALRKSSDDRPPCLENPRPEGAESTLTENVASPFHAEPRQTAIESVKVYPDALRRVSYLDTETNKRLKFLTNNFVLPAFTIAQIYKCRWQVELFFRWIKQHLRIKSFFGTSANAVRTQIWIAVSTYLLVAIVRKRLGLRASLYQILQILSVTLFEKVPILRALEAPSSQDDLLEDPKQLILFNF